MFLICVQAMPFVDSTGNVPPAITGLWRTGFMADAIGSCHPLIYGRWSVDDRCYRDTLFHKT